MVCGLIVGQARFFVPARCTPGRVDSLPAKGNSDDEVSSPMWCAAVAKKIGAAW